MTKGVETKYLLAFNAHPKIGSQTLKKILAAFPDPSEIWKASESTVRGKLTENIAVLVLEAKKSYDPEKEIEKLKKYDLGYITIFDSDYPPLLKQIYDAPVVLYIRGSIKVLKNQCLAVVGSRKYSNYGKNITYQLAKKLAANNLTIVSGLALGVDAFAHRAALDAGGRTVGVIGCGLDRIYPASNFALGREIIEKDGAVISEFPLGTPPLKFNFPARNRIIAGLSLGVLVTEAALESGALITAYQALEYNRDVFAVPGNIDSETSLGTNKLIKEGARMVTDVADILAELNIEERISEDLAREILSESAEEKLIIDILNAGEKLGDEIIAESGLNVIALNTTLSMMEMKGLVVNLGGGRYKLAHRGK